MKNKVKKIFNNKIFTFILGGIVFSSISVMAATYFESNAVTYDNTESGLTSTNVQGAIDELYEVCFTPKTGSDTITDLVEINPNELYKDEHGDIRYYGKDPNNYVIFNNELWRIIGLIDGKIKIIRNESIGNYYWSSDGKNNWNNSDLKSYLNGEYYNNITNIYKNMISEEIFYLGGPSSNKISASEFYDAERGKTAYSGNPVNTKQYIGLMYPSDYGYAAGSSCLSTSLENYKNGCYNNDYLFDGASRWLQTPYSSRNYNAAFIGGYGSGYVLGGVVGNRVDTDDISVYPSLYLSSEVQITEGIGSKSDPYKLSL